MNRIKNIKSIQIDIDDIIKIEITRIEKVLKELHEDDTFDEVEVLEEVTEVITFELHETEKIKAMNEFLDAFQLRDKTKVKLEGRDYDTQK